jgi:hypothetical protein
VVEVGNEYHAKCDYCGATEGTDCTLVIMLPITLVLIVEFGLFIFALPFHMLFLLFDAGLIYAVYQGSKASDRVARRKRTEDIY